MTEETKTANITDQFLHQHDAEHDHQRRNEWIGLAKGESDWLRPFGY